MARARTLTIACAAGASWLLPAAAGAQFLRQNPSLVKKTNAPEVLNLASLAGCWKGRGPSGGDVRLYYELVSDNTALVEYLRPVGTTTPQMSVYYLDGETLTAHHFCFFGSQIRMKARPSSDPKTLEFRIADATNLSAERHEYHMTYIRFLFLGPDRVEADWGLWDKGQEVPGPFSFSRVSEGCRGLEMTW